LRVIRSYITLLALVLPFAAVAQQDAIPLDRFYVDRKGVSPFRKILSRINWGLSLGYGRTYFSHELPGFGVYQGTDLPPQIFQAGAVPGTRYSNWVTQSQTNADPLTPSPFLVSSDDPPLGFRARAINMPLKATLHVEFLKRFRVGAGYSLELMNVGAFSPISFTDQIGSFRLANRSGMMSKYFILAGGSFYRFQDYLFTADVQFGGYNPGKNFDKAQIDRSLFFNLGVTVERDLSEYFRVFVRPSYEVKNYGLSLPETGLSLKHNLNAFYLNFGVTYRIPELPRCFHRNCQAQINHAHGNREYRSRMHPLWKKQNPGYGENSPTLIKYKGKNKRRINP
jgi:hypothetical protein